MSTIVNVRVDANTKDATKNVGKFNDKLKDTSKATKDVQADLSEVKNQADAATGGAISKFRGLIGTIKNVSKSFVTLKGAIVATGLGALVLVIGSIVQAFRSSEEGQNKFAKIMGIIGSVVGNLTDKLSDLGEKIIENPLELIFMPLRGILKRLKALLMLVPNLGKALNLVFKGKFEEAGTIAADAFLAIGTGVENTTEKIKEFGKEVIEDGKNAAKVADARAKADKASRQLTIERAEADRKRAELLEKAVDKENFNTQQRIEFLKQAGALEEQITNKEIEAAKLRADAKVLENSLSKSTKEDLEEEANLKAEVIRLETARLTKQKEVTSQTIALLAEDKAARDAIDAQKKADQDAKDAADLEAAKTLADLKNQIRDAEAVSEDERRALEIQKVQEHYDNLIALAEQNGLDTTNLKAARDKKIDELNKDATEKELEWADITTEQKLDMASGALNDMATIMGKESAAGKAAAAAAATISTFSSATKAYDSMAAIPVVGPALGAVAAGAAVVAGMANVKKILSTKTPAGGGGSPSLGVTASAAPASQPPDFNIVGSNSQNQLAETIAGSQNKPVKAYVVSNEVSSAQALDRNIVESASLG
tara:strand:- start:285 stop:2078 length:1794 start_codon:yes stop_codon:yes gene_type:complete